MLDFSSVVSILSAAFALSIALECQIAYRRMKRELSLSLSAAFILLAVSFVLLIPLAFGIELPTIGYDSGNIRAYPPRIVIESFAYIILAMSYTAIPRVKQLLYVLIGLLIGLVVLVMVPKFPAIPYSVDTVLFLLHSALLAYVLYQMWRIAKPIKLVFSAFAILFLSQVVELTNSLAGVDIFMLSQSLRLLSFVALFSALLISNRPVPIAKIQKQNS